MTVPAADGQDREREAHPSTRSNTRKIALVILAIVAAAFAFIIMGNRIWEWLIPFIKSLFRTSPSLSQATGRRLARLDMTLMLPLLISLTPARQHPDRPARHTL